MTSAITNQTPLDNDARPQDFFQGGGELGALMRSHDWAATPLNSPEHWPRSLQSIVRMMLTSRYQMWMAWGPELTFFCNDAYRPTLGVKHPWALGQPASQVWAEIWPDVGPLIEHVLRTGEATYSEGMLLFLERSGFTEETYHTFSYSPLFDDSNAIAGMFCVVVEETERVINERRMTTLRKFASATAITRTEADLFEAVSRQFSDNLSDLPFTVTYLFDDGGSCARRVAMSGIDGDHAAAPAVMDVRSAPWPMRAILDNAPSVIVEDLAHRFGPLPTGAWDQPPHAALVVPVAQQAHDASPAGFIVIGLNPFRAPSAGFTGFVELLSGQVAAALAAAKAYEQERKRAEALAEIDRAKTAFFSNVSHEFRTPLTLMLGPLEDLLANRARRGGDEVHRQIELAHRNGVRLLHLVNSLRDFSRIEAGRVRMAHVPTDLATFSAEIASSFRSTMERAGLALVVKSQPLPGPVHLDREMWEKILLNLLSNAFKFTFEGTITLETAASDDGRVAVTRVSDTGIGIAREELPRLFERFHRVEGARGRTFEGSGIGLALVEELVRLHGGDIGVDSEPGRGTTFSVALPLGTAHLARADIQAASGTSPPIHADTYVDEALRWLPDPADIAGQDGAAAVASDPGAGPRPGHGQRVVLADDNADMRNYVRRLLIAEGYEVDAVGDGEAALAAARACAPDLVLSDVMMPRLDGFGLLRAIRGEPAIASTPVVLLSARAGEEAKVEGLDAGADDYLIKPFAARELLARVASNIRMARFRRNAAREMIRNEQHLLLTRDRLGLALSTGRIAVFEVDVSARIATVLGPLTQFFGVSEDDAARGLPHAMFMAGIHPDDRERVSALIESAISTGAPYEAEYRLAGGHEPRRVVARGSLQVGASGERRFAGAVIDISHEKAAEDALRERSEALQRENTQRRAAEAQLQALNADLEERVIAEVAQRMKTEEALRQAHKMEAVGQLTGGVAHDFNNLLTVIIGGLDIIRRSGPTDNMRLNRALDMATQGAQRAATLTARLLAFSRRQPLEPKPLDLNMVVRESIELLHRTLGEPVELDVMLSPRLWPVEVDQNQLESAILNLAVNARDAMPSGGRLTIQTSNTELDGSGSAHDADVLPGPYVVMAISDNGTGMPKQVLDRVFEPFYTTKDVGRGTGLGLSMVYGFVKQSGGHVAIQSQEGSGTTVQLYFPRYRGKLPASEHPSRPASPTGQRDEIILVVEDNDDVRDYSVAILTELGYGVVQAPDAESALAILKQPGRIDLLFSDVVLPGRTGRALADEAAVVRPGIRVLFTTGYSRDAIMHQGRLDAGVNLITKPFSFEQLAVRIRDILDR